MSDFLMWGIQSAIALGIGAIGYFIKQQEKKTDERISQNEKELNILNSKIDNKTAALEEKISILKEELPQKYVLKDDFIRAMSNVDTKLDKIYDVVTIKKGGETK